MKNNSSRTKRVSIAVCALAAIMSISMLAGCGKSLTKKRTSNQTTQTQSVNQGKQKQKSNSSSSKKGGTSTNTKSTAMPEKMPSAK